MRTIDIDVIAQGGKKDLALKTFRTELVRQAGLAKSFGFAGTKKLILDVKNVFEMVDQIAAAVGSHRIGRLRIFGHGSSNTIQIAPFQFTGRQVEDFLGQSKIDSRDRDKLIQLITTQVKRPDGSLVRVENELLSEKYLEKLSGKFGPRSWVELHSCQIVGNEGKEFIKSLSDLWQTEVHASERKQIVGGGLEGRIWVAKPKRNPFIKRPKTGFNYNPSGFLEKHDPIKEAARRLEFSPASLKPISSGSSLGDLLSGTQFQRDQFDNRYDQYIPSGGRLGQTPPANQIRPNWMQEAKRQLEMKPFSSTIQPTIDFDKFRPKNTIQSGGFEDRFEIDPHRSISSGSKIGHQTFQEFNPHNDPIKEAARRLGSPSQATRPMQAGTMYSNIYTGKTFQVGKLGGHHEIGSTHRYAGGPGRGSSSQSFGAHHNPIREAARRLGG